MFKTEIKQYLFKSLSLDNNLFSLYLIGISFQLPLKIKENGALLLEAFLDILLPKILSSFTKYIFDTFFRKIMIIFLSLGIEFYINSRKDSLNTFKYFYR